MKFDFSKSNPAHNLTEEWILSKIDDVTIMYYYHGPFQLGRIYHSKFVRDRNGSAGFYINKRGRVTYNHLNGRVPKLDCFGFVMRMYGLTHIQALHKIARDFGLVDVDSSVPVEVVEQSKQIDLEAKKDTLIQIIPKQWSKEDLDYWKLFEITQKELDDNQVYSIKEAFINKIPYHNYKFAYSLENEDKTLFKLYNPLSKDGKKWRTNIPLSIPFGLQELPFKSDTIIISKAKKDMILLKRLFTDVIAVQSENPASLPTDLQEYLISKYKRRIIIFDADPPGVESCKTFNDKGFDYFNTPNIDYIRYGVKDIADYVRYFGFDMLIELFKNKNLI